MTGLEMPDMSIEQLNLAFEIEGLTPGQKVVLLILANRANKKSEAWPSIRSMGRQSCMSRSGVKNALRGLRDRGLLFWKWRRNRANVYTLTLEIEASTRSLSDQDAEESKGHTLTEGGQAVTLKRSLTDPVVVTQCPQTQKNHQLTIMEPKDGDHKNLNVDAWREYTAYRRETKLSTLKAISERKQKSRMAKFSVEVQAETVNQTIANGWAGLFPEKIDSQVKKSHKSDSFYDRVARNIALVAKSHG